MMKAQMSLENKALLCRWVVHNAMDHKSYEGFNLFFYEDEEL